MLFVVGLQALSVARGGRGRGGGGSQEFVVGERALSPVATPPQKGHS